MTATSNNTMSSAPGFFFPLKLHALLSDVEREGSASDVVSWMPHGRSFRVHDKERFTTEILPRWFQMKSFPSFVRQLNLYGFQRLTSAGPDRGAYFHVYFHRGDSALCYRIERIKIKGTGCRQPSTPELEPDFYTYPPLSNTQSGQAVVEESPQPAAKKTEIHPPAKSPTTSKSPSMSGFAGVENERPAMNLESLAYGRYGRTSAFLDAATVRRELHPLDLKTLPSLNQRPTVDASKSEIEEGRAAAARNDKIKTLAAYLMQKARGAARQAAAAQFLQEQRKLTALTSILQQQQGNDRKLESTLAAYHLLAAATNKNLPNTTSSSLLQSNVQMVYPIPQNEQFVLFASPEDCYNLSKTSSPTTNASTMMMDSIFSPQQQKQRQLLLAKLDAALESQQRELLQRIWRLSEMPCDRSPLVTYP